MAGFKFTGSAVASNASISHDATLNGTDSFTVICQVKSAGAATDAAVVVHPYLTDDTTESGVGVVNEHTQTQMGSDGSAYCISQYQTRGLHKVKIYGTNKNAAAKDVQVDVFIS